MVSSRREIFVKLDKLQTIVSLMKEIKEQEQEIHQLFKKYKQIADQENKMIATWGHELDNINDELVEFTS